MRALFTADFQADFENLDLCELARDQILFLCRTQRLNTIVVAGDLKRQYNPVDVRVTAFWVDFIYQAKQLGIQMVLGLGNHDRVGMYADAQNWFPILRKSGATAVDEAVVLTELRLAVLPFMSKPKVWRDAARRLSRSRPADVLVFHAELHGLKYNMLGKESTQSDYQLADLHSEKYRYCIGGHVHLHQRLGENVYYVGSPFCTDWGEANQQKGFLILQEHELTFVKSSIPGWYDPTWPGFPRNKTDWDGCRLRIHVKVPVGVQYGLLVEKAVREAEKRYAGASVVSVVDFEDEAPVEVRFRPDTSDGEKIEAYVQQTLPSALGEDLERVVAFLKYYTRKGSQGSTVRHGKPLRFVGAKASEFLSFESLKLDFAKQGIVLVTGRNEDWQGRSNGAGKSNATSVIPVCLFGATFKGQKHDAWARRGVKGESRVQLTLRDARDRELRIVRARSPHRFQLWVDGVDHSSGMGRGQGDTQSLVETLSGFTWQTLANAVYIDQSLVSAFLLGTQKERKEILERLQNLERFKKAAGYVKEAQQRVAVQLGDLVLAREKLESEIAICKQMMPVVSGSAIGEAEKLQDRCAAQEALVRELEAATKHRVTEWQNLVARTVAALNVGQKNQQQLGNQIVVVETQLAGSRALSEKLVRVSAKSVCPTCRGVIEKVRLQVLIQETDDQIETRVQSVRKLRTKLEKEQLETSRWEAERRLFEDRIEKATYRLANASELLVQLSKEFDHWQQVAKEERQVQRRWELKLEGMVRRLENLTAAESQYGKDGEMLTYALAALSRSGIPAFLNRGVCPQLNRAAEYYAELFCSKQIQIRFEVGEDGEFAVAVLNLTGGKEIEDQSAGEKKLAALITVFALREIAPPCNVLILDEPGDSLDPANARAFARGLRELRGRFDSIFVTSHNPHIVAELSDGKVWTVVKKRGVSRLELSEA